MLLLRAGDVEDVLECEHVDPDGTQLVKAFNERRIADYRDVVLMSK